MQTLSVILSLICRLTMVAIALTAVATHFPGNAMPRASQMTQDWMIVVGCDGLAMVAPLLRFRNAALIAGLLALGVHYGYQHHVPMWSVWYTGVAILLVLLPRYKRKVEKGRGLLGGSS